MPSSGLRRLRKRVETAMARPAAQAVPALVVARYLSRVFARSEWIVEGRGALAQEASRGPVILAVWHGRLLCAARFWDRSWGDLTTLTSQQYPGRLAGQAFRHFGLPTVAMHDRQSNRGESLALARAIRAGMSIGIAVDGPLGPARVAKTVPLDWSRLTGAPIWCVGFSASAMRQLNSWDNLMVPRAGGQACLLYRRWGVAEKTADAETARAALEEMLSAVTRAADLKVGHASELP